jgi:ATP-dependent DNA helicase RecG
MILLLFFIDDRMNQRASLQALSRSLIQEYLRDVGSELAETMTEMPFMDLCRRMNLVDGPQEALLPRNVGLMFFNEQPDLFFPQAQIDVVLFPDGPGGERLIEKSFKGPLSRMLQNALRYIETVVVTEHVVKHPDRAEAERFFSYPYAAIEELLVNAVYHRSYEIREPIEVRVVPEEMTITSYPGPDRSISLAALAQGRLVARRYRNRRIGEFLKELHLTEGRGTGIPTVLRVMSANGSPLPRFETDADRGYFTAILPAHRSALGGATPQVSRSEDTGATQIDLDARSRELLAFCRRPQDRASILSHLRLKDVKHLRLRYLQPLVESGLLTMTDPAHPHSPAQSYQTTAQGRQVLQDHDQT